MLRAMLIRPAHTGDLARLGEVAYHTGFFGESAARYFPDAALFADLWVAPYLRLDVNVSFVAELDGVTCGYILGAADGGSYGRALRAVLVDTVAPGMVLGRYRRPFGAGRYLARAAAFPSPHAPDAVYPAHLHVNLLPAARGLGVGRALLETFLARLVALRVGGVQLSTTSENQAALRLYRQAGFHVSRSRVTPLWTPWLGHPAQHLCLARSL